MATFADLLKFRGSDPAVRWEAPLTLDGVLRRRKLRGVVRQYRRLSIEWRSATAADWPERPFIGGRFRSARKRCFGFVADVGAERLFLVPNKWDQAEWGLAKFELPKRRWRDLGDLEPVPNCWTFPHLNQSPPSS
jgi:hypothetical protein